MLNSLNGKNAVVTGAGRGVGKAIALALASHGVNVVVNDLGVARDGSGNDVSAANETVAEIINGGGKAVANYDSVSEWASAERIIQSCVDNFGRIDILVNNAGFVRERMMFNMSESDWSAVIGVMLNGSFFCSRHASVFMRQQKSGRIINITSGAWLGSPGQINYVAAKAGIVGLTKGAAHDLGRYGITCNAVIPHAGTRMTLTEELKQQAKKRLEAGLITKDRYESLTDWPDPAGATPMILYLATDEAAGINGTVFRSESGKISIYSEPAEMKSIFRNYKRDGIFPLSELMDVLPSSLLSGYISAAPVSMQPFQKNE